MKKHLLLPLLLLFLSFGCSSTDDTATDTSAKELIDVAYGNDPEQAMDVYLPEGRDENTKVIILVHGGTWVSGDKDDFSYVVPIIQAQFPHHAIVNINYRLATPESPALPKQIDDIAKVIGYLEDSDYNISDDYAFIGFSAGAHLSMLYSYKHDHEGDVKAVADIVGPADLGDPAYENHEVRDFAALNLTGTINPDEATIADLSPVTHITPQAPPTIMFYGGMDPLVPSSQGPILKAKLDEAGVPNEYYFYENGGHGDWDLPTTQQMYGSIINFLQQHL